MDQHLGRPAAESSSKQSIRSVLRLKRQIVAPRPQPADQPLTLSWSQQRLWLLDQIEPNTPFYNTPIIYRLRGPLDPDRLAWALNQIIARHSVLRTNIRTVAGQPEVVIAPVRTLPLALLDLADAGAARDQRVRAAITALVLRPFDLSSDLLVDAGLLRLAPDEHIFVFNAHQIVFDGPSKTILIEELAQRYAALAADRAQPSAADLPPLPLQYSDVAAWERNWLQGELLDVQIRYWRQKLHGGVPALNLPLSRPRGPIHDPQNAVQPIMIGAQLRDALKALSQQHGVTLFVTLTAALNLWLYCYTRQTDLLILSSTAGRSQFEGIKQMIGLFSRPLLLRTDLAGEPSVQSLLLRMRDVVQEAYAHQDAPLEELAGSLSAARQQTFAPLFQLVFALSDEVTTPELRVDKLLFEPMQDEYSAAKAFDLALNLTNVDDGLRGVLLYKRELFDAQLIAQMVADLVVLLDFMTRQPGAAISQAVPLVVARGAALPPDEAEPAAPAALVTEPTADFALSTSVGAQLQAIWSRLLDRPQIDPSSNFWSLGGHSLMAMQMVNEIQTTFALSLPARVLFQVPTLDRLTQVISAALDQGAAEVTLPHDELDLEREVVLDATIDPASAAPLVDVDVARHYLLTGATGFLGAFLLAELLEQTEAIISCLVRAESPEQAAERIRQNLMQYGVWQPAYAARIVAVPGDLSRPCFGLSTEQYAALAASVEGIYHNGAQVNFVYPYSRLKPVNVDGTHEVLRFACHTRCKPLHFISTLAVFSSTAYFDGGTIDERTPLTYGNQLLYGYAQSKWVAEQLVALAQARGLPVSVYRPGAVVGHSQSGISNTVDYICRFIKGCVQLGLLPDLDQSWRLTPVEYVSQALVKLSRQPELVGGTFHLCNPHAATLAQIADVIRAYGYPLQEVSYEAWRDALLAEGRGSAQNALYPMLPFVVDRIAAIDGQQLALPQLFTQRYEPHYDTAATERALADSTISCPPVSDALVECYLSYFVRSGFMAAPPATVESAGG